MAKRNLIRGSVLFVRHVVPATIRPARTLWNEVIGFLFSVFAGIAALSGIQTARHLNGDPGSVIKLILIVIFVIIMGSYGISSFRKARRISRS